MPYKFKGKRDCTQSDGSKGKYQTVKKDGSKRCYKSEKQYKSSMAWGHGESDTLDGEVIEEYRKIVRAVLLEHLGPIQITVEDPPVPDSIEELEDLEKVIQQHGNRVVPESLQERCDNDMEGLMAEYLSNRGISIKTEEVTKIRKSVKPIVTALKNYHDRERPDVTAARLGVYWHDDFLESADSPSYPSGHTIQAYVCAGHLSKKYPEYSKGLFLIAELISQSRIDRGVHFPSDVDYGRKIAKELIDQGF